MGGFFTRSKDKPAMLTRGVAIDGERALKTIDSENRSIGEVVATTEDPVSIYDWEHGRVNEVLLMSGMVLPKGRQVPLLNSHSRWGVEDVLGSARDWRVSGDEALCSVHFASTPLAAETFTKAEEKHLTDFSVGYRVLKSVFVPQGQTATIEGRSFTGPVVVRTRWQIHELSITPIGADPRAKGRNENFFGGAEMPEWLKKLLEKRGLRSDATDEEIRAFAEEHLSAEEAAAAAQPAAPAQTRSDNAVSLEDIRQASRAEEARKYEIRLMVRQHLPEDTTDLADKLVIDGKTVDQARQLIMDELAKRGRANSPGVAYGSMGVGTEAAEKFRQAATGSLILRTGGKLEKDEFGAADLRGYTMCELARECLRNAGRSFGGDPREMVGRALTTSDFSNILADVANRNLLDGFNAAGETFDIWTDVIAAADFKPINLVGISEFSDLDLIGQNDEFKHGKLSDKKETVQLATYGKLMLISRQAIINNDLGVLSTGPQRMGRAAKRKEGDVVYSVLTANAAMADGVTLFHADHANVGTGAAFSITTLEEFEKLIGLQKDISGKVALNLRLEYIIAPVSIKSTIETFFMSEWLGTQAKPTTRNRFAGNVIQRVYDARLDAASLTAFYGATTKGLSVVRAYLNGQQAPYLENRDGWTVDGLETKVRHDIAAAASDHRGLLYNAGTAG